MTKYILRLDMEIDTLGGEKMMGHLTNSLIKFAQNEMQVKHYSWAFVPSPEGFNNPDLEKELRYSMGRTAGALQRLST